MSRKHFRLMAANLLALKPNATDSNVFTLDPKVKLWRELVESVADVLRDANERFDRDRFYAACGVTDNEGGG